MNSRAINVEIEYLRAVAVLLVILAHLPALFPGVNFYGQWTGVDLFFCISGFVISRAYEQLFDQSIRDGRWWAAAKAFWVRRIFRLTPSAWLWLSITILCAWTFNQSGWFVSLDRAVTTALYFVTLTTNFALSRESLRPNGYFWSLTLEDQFYFLFPIFLLIVRGKWRYFALLAFIVLQAIPDRSLPLAGQPSLLWVTRLDALMWGILIQRFSRSDVYWKLAPTMLRYRVLALAVSACLIFVLIKTPVGYFYPWIGFRIEAFVALASAGLVLLASYDRGYALPLPWPLDKAFRWIGERSYAIYLIHLPAFGICQEIWFRWLSTWGLTEPRYWYAIGAPVLTAVLADLNFRLVENPLRAYGVRLSRRILGADPHQLSSPVFAPQKIAGG
ncbi:acyltransferase [Bradyrhizobium lablabi]|uniref:acyltransferase family protein n=1 Tax=Bradyrhizobium lablabi TaxID=722472 RepID=UPI001BA59755|nr:acyltransferase [Bradyrhizobium lablabi]MBR1124990.1 acyltransferase [Bradyrhizobium lablabi]